MKVLLLCHSQTSPGDSMNNHASQSVLLRVMKYYARHGHKDFVLCLSEQGCIIKNYFSKFNNLSSTDFVLTSGSVINLIGTDVDEWNITFEGSSRSINQSKQIFEIKRHLKDESYFVVNEWGQVPECSLNEFIDQFVKSSQIGTAFGNLKKNVQHGFQAGSFIFRSNVLAHLKPNDEVSIKTFIRLLNDPSVGTQFDPGWQVSTS